MSEFDAPQSRVEALLQNILGAENPYGAPQSRIEAILQNMLGANNVLLPPESRNEELLLEILQQGGGGKPTQTKTATPTEQEQTITPDDGYVLSEVTVEAIPSEYVDTSEATATAADITLGKTAAANGEMITGTHVDPEAPTGTIPITANGTYDVSQYAEAIVNTNPTIGMVFTDFTVDGYPQTIRTYGYQGLPSDFFISMGQRAYNNRSYFSRYITYVYLNDGILTIGSSSLREMNRVKEIHFPATVTQIENYCWNSDTYIELLDFSNCTDIPTLEIRGNDNLPSGCVIRVPQNLLEDWQEETNWIDLPTDPNVAHYVVWEGV